MIASERFCIFCGKPPTSKNKEHVLPQWLIKVTGDPKRTVRIGRNPQTGSEIRFDWSSLTFPSCSSCNEKYSNLVNNAKDIIHQLLERSPVKVSNYVIMLDWLDKVRIGLWLGYYYLHQNPIGIQPTFHINDRMGFRDRMLAVYTIDTSQKGLNTDGAETFYFQVKPSCFALRINNIYILNMSWGFMCSARCGFPYPRDMRMVSDNGKAMFEISNFRFSGKVKTPILRTKRKLIKPSIHLYQPILTSALATLDLLNKDVLKARLLPKSDHMGVLFRQQDNSVEILTDQDANVVNGEIRGLDCKPMKDIRAQTYDLQKWSFNIDGKLHSHDQEAYERFQYFSRIANREAALYKNYFASLQKT